MREQAGVEAQMAALRGVALALLLLAGAAGAVGAAGALLSSVAMALFLFASGWVVAPVLLSVAAREGPAAVALRVAHRIWQIYWRHIGAIVLSAAILAASAGPDGRAAALTTFGLGGLVETPRETWLAIALLAEQPAAFAAPATYALILLAAPLVVWIGARNAAVAAALCVGLFLAPLVLGGGAPFFAPANKWPLDPFAWQLVFYAGFAFGAGWVPSPWEPSAQPSETPQTPWSRLAAPFTAVGRQSLAALIALGPILALLQGLFGAAPGAAERGIAAGTGLALLYGAARVSAWFQDPPWGRPAVRRKAG